MTQYNTLNVKLSKSQPNKLKSGIKNGTQVILNLSSNMIDIFNDEISFLHKLLLNNRQASRFHKAFANGSSANIKLSKVQLSKIGRSVRFSGRRLRPLLKASLTVMKNVFKPLAKSA